MIPIKPAARRRARQLTLQSLYQWQLSAAPIEKIKQEFYQHVDMKKVDTEYFDELLADIIPRVNELDKIFEPFLDRPLEELTPIELAILRLATYELCNRLDIPYRVVINEALELTKSFGATEGHKYVNGILDKVAQKSRAAEMKD